MDPVDESQQPPKNDSTSSLVGGLKLKPHLSASQIGSISPRFRGENRNIQYLKAAPCSGCMI